MLAHVVAQVAQAALNHLHDTWQVWTLGGALWQTRGEAWLADRYGERGGCRRHALAKLLRTRTLIACHSVKPVVS